jgi:hypothetical protein
LPDGDRIALVVLAVAGMIWVVGAGSASRFTAATAQQLAQPGLYSDAVLRHAPVPPHAARGAP